MKRITQFWVALLVPLAMGGCAARSTVEKVDACAGVALANLSGSHYQAYIPGARTAKVLGKVVSTFKDTECNHGSCRLFVKASEGFTVAITTESGTDECTFSL